MTETTIKQSMPVRRPWWRLHLSTLLLATPLVAVVAAIMVPVDNQTWPEFGWPYPFTRNELTQTHPDFCDAFAGWPMRKNWIPPRGAMVSWSGLLADLGLALAFIVPPVALLEWRRRQRRRVWQFSLGEAFVAMLVSAVALGWLGRVKLDHDRDMAAFETLKAWVRYPMVSCEVGAWRGDEDWNIADNTAPGWFKRLLSTDSCDWFVRHRCLYLMARPGEDPALPAAKLGDFRSLEALALLTNPAQASEVVQFAEQSGLVALQLNVGQLSDELVERLARVDGLRHVTLYQFNAESTGIVERLRKLRPDLIFDVQENSLSWNSREES